MIEETPAGIALPRLASTISGVGRRIIFHRLCPFMLKEKIISSYCSATIRIFGFQGQGPEMHLLNKNPQKTGWAGATSSAVAVPANSGDGRLPSMDHLDELEGRASHFAQDFARLKKMARYCGSLGKRFQRHDLAWRASILRPPRGRSGLHVDTAAISGMVCVTRSRRTRKGSSISRSSPALDRQRRFRPLPKPAATVRRAPDRRAEACA